VAPLFSLGVSFLGDYWAAFAQNEKVVEKYTERVEAGESYRFIGGGSPQLMWTEKQADETWCVAPGRILFGNYRGQVSLRGMIESSAELG
jgi:hypothetical protein